MSTVGAIALHVSELDVGYGCSKTDKYTDKYRVKKSTSDEVDDDDEESRPFLEGA